MLNKIWAGLIIIGLLFAVGQDIQDEISNTYKNGIIHQVSYSNTGNSSNQLNLTLNKATLIATIKPDQKIHIHLDTNSPAYLQNIADANGNKNRLIARITSKNNTQLNLLLPELHWNKLRNVTQAAFDM
ncbi:MAG: hypothetical protein OQK46_02835, partial [Gammaproteobacteria bacterium]|nr:hypothetical protein [Gammaproteobacteria bacterium]